jgi:acylphosphatase
MAEDKQTERLHAVVEGLVQGVGFRAFVADQAAELGVVGWVRNTYDGQVEVTAEGPREALLMLANALREGPPISQVTQVATDWQAATGEFDRFRVAYTV